MYRIFIVEDSPSVAQMLELNLTLSGYQTRTISNGLEARRLLETDHDFDLALVDVMLPGVEGFDLLPDFHARDIPVIFLTARGDLDSKIKGLSGGAEDYVVKPFQIAELLLRMDKVLSRWKGQVTLLSVGGLEIDTIRREVQRDGALISLTPIEYDLLLLLARHPNVGFSRQQLLTRVWGDLYTGNTRTVDVHVAHLRKKTGLNIVTIAKVGYRLEVGS